MKKKSDKKSGKQHVVENGIIAQKVIALIHLKMNEFTKRQRFLAEYIINFPEKIGYLSITQLAEASGVSVATIFRFCNKLGYNGYVELGEEVQKSIQFELSTLMRFGIGRESAKSQEADQESTFERIIRIEMDSIERMSNSVKRKDLDTCIDWMFAAKNVIIIGSMGSASLASYFGYATSKVLRSVTIINQVGAESPNIIKELNRDSLVFLIAYPRYPESSLMFGRLCKEKGCKIVSITNDNHSPTVHLSDMVFFIPISVTSIVDSFSAPITFIHALIAEYSIRFPKKTNDFLNSFEHYTKNMKIWHKPK
jgi:DNA-binding MurR/RpiR family transcriptional regulator